MMEAKLFLDLLPEMEDSLIDIHTAASMGCDERVRDIIENSETKCIIDQHNKKGWTPLMYAAYCANLKVVLLLLEEGAKTDLKNFEGHTALILASKCGSSDVVSLLINNGAKVNEKDKRGWTALFYAVAFGHKSVVQLLVERGAVIDIMDINERITPLMLAAAAGHERIVQDLLQSGVNINVECKSGDTARSLAVKNGFTNIKNLIDAFVRSKRKNNGPNLKSNDLASLLKDLQLTKYYYVFENHDIDLNTFWLLNDDDLKEIGIQEFKGICDDRKDVETVTRDVKLRNLVIDATTVAHFTTIRLLGPRKKMCMAISQYHQEHSKRSNSKENLDNVRMENKKLHHLTEKLKAMVLHEQNSRASSEQNLADGIQSMKIYNEKINNAVDQAVNLLEKQRENNDFLKRMIYSVIQDMKYSNALKAKIDSIVQSLDCTQKLVEMQHQCLLAIQQTSSHNKTKGK